MQTKSQSELKAVKGLKTLDDIIDQTGNIACDVITGEITHQRATSSTGAIRAMLNGIELHHNLGGDVTRFIKKAGA